MMTTLLDTSAVLAQQHIDELRRQAANERLARTVRRGRRGRRAGAAGGGGLHPATLR